MSKYQVCVTRVIVTDASLEIEAESMEEAVRLARSGPPGETSMNDQGELILDVSEGSPWYDPLWHCHSVSYDAAPSD